MHREVRPIAQRLPRKSDTYIPFLKLFQPDSWVPPDRRPPPGLLSGPSKERSQSVL